MPEEDKLHNDKPAQAEAEPAIGIEELKHVLIEEKRNQKSIWLIGKEFKLISLTTRGAWSRKKWK